MGFIIEKEKTTLAFTTEIGTFGSMPIEDPTVKEVQDVRKLAKDTKDKNLKKYLEENLHN